MEGKYSLIFMADNGKTARLRLGPALLRSLVALLALLPIVAGVSLWLNWKLYEDRRSVLSENAILRATVDGNAQTVARLSGLEQFLQQAAPESLGELVAVSDVPPAPDMETGTEGAASPDMSAASAAPATSAGEPAAASSGASVSADKPTDASPVPSASGNAEGLQQNTPEAPAAEITTPLASVPSEQYPDARATAAPVLGAEPDIAPEAGAEPLAEVATDGPVANVDTGFARVENLVARRVGSRSLRISFDLFNAGQVPQLGGHTTFELITKDGQSVELAAHGDTTYRINRLKKIVGNPTLPADMTDIAGVSVRVSIFADKELIYRITTPLQ